ncbi:DNA-processing protein DprA [Oscillatoria acuminata]|uniref:DNA protecting protein DprA n=1 Tax=Oscillatoria acuminata PCC 6304 TaxID=56110 RepID=K9TGK9_9CYAN|nr:DNA-processing protein DprA [Oscillatoria acuminata]AFY81680.1 DNA protecting protein DprA [Oscillatoria acuminata PCC 6304]
MYLEERAFWVAWSQIPAVGPVMLGRLFKYFGSLAAAWQAEPEALTQVQGLGPQLVEKIVTRRSQLNPEQLYSEHLRQNPNFWTPADPDYPRLLGEIPNPPPLLYYQGHIDRQETLGNRPIVGIVGTRNPSEYGQRWTRRISQILAECGFTIVSGMAAGIDTHAHLGCLDADGRTIAVFGTPLNKIYPETNRHLSEKIIQKGLFVSEHPVGTLTRREHFAQRNRIIAGLSQAILVMEAPERSGALITAKVANEYSRDVFALPGRIDDPNSQGCLRLLKNGAETIINETELLEMLGAIPKYHPTPAPTAATPTPSTAVVPPLPVVPDLEPPLQQVWEATEIEPIAFDLIVSQAQLDAASVSSALLQLELIGLVEQLPGMRYRRI